MLRNAALVTRRLLGTSVSRSHPDLTRNIQGLLQRETATGHSIQTACLSTHTFVAPKLLVVHPNRKSDALLQEALRLAESYAGSDCPHVGVGPTKHFNITPSTYFGPGVVKSIQEACEAQEPSKLFVNVALSPVQQRNLEAAVGLPVLDRVGLIIEIFAQRARTSEARLQVELAALDYRSSRLVRTLDSKTGQRGGFGEGGTTEVVSARERGRSGSSSGGLGGASGGGQSELQLQRQRLIARRKALQKKLAEVQRTREVQRAARRRAGKPVVAVVGYTNAGKSSLLQALTRTDAGVQDRLFATLDPALRRVHLPSGREAILSDTVGFISELPHQLVNAFRATLEEVCEADLLLHVLDASSPSVVLQRQAVLQVLRDLGIPEAKLQNALLEVWNKTDLIQAPASEGGALHQHPCSNATAQHRSQSPAGPPQLDTKPSSTDSMQRHAEEGAAASCSAAHAPESQPCGAAGAQQLGVIADSSQLSSQPGHDRHQASPHQPLASSNVSHVTAAGIAMPDEVHTDRQPDQQTAAPQARAVPQRHQYSQGNNDVQHRTDLSQSSHPLQPQSNGQPDSAQVASGAQQAGVKPLMLYTSTVTGQGLPELLLEVERKLSLKWATRDLADGTARLGPRLLTHTIVGPASKQRRPRWRGAGQWESVLTQSLRDQSTTAADDQADAMHAHDIRGWARKLLQI